MSAAEVLLTTVEVQCPGCGFEDVYEFGADDFDTDVEEGCGSCGRVLRFAVSVVVTSMAVG